jgi:hypothetical protein
VRNRATVIAERLLDGEAEALTRQAIAMALDGDTTALRLCLERVIAPRRDRPFNFKLSPPRSPEDASAALASIAAALASGMLAADQARELARLIESFLGTLGVAEFGKRIAALEQSMGITTNARIRALTRPLPDP